MITFDETIIHSRIKPLVIKFVYQLIKNHFYAKNSRVNF